MNADFITVSSPEIAVKFLKDQDIVFSSRPDVLSADITSRGYLTTALSPLGGQWKKMRRVLASDVLSTARHRWLQGKRTEEADHLVRGRERGACSHVDALFKILAYLFSFCVSDFLPFLRGHLDLDGHEKIVRTATATMAKYQDPEIDKRIRQWIESTKTEQEDLLDVLIGLKENDGTPLLSPDEIKAQIVELMLATVDNPSNAVEWAIAEMINEPATLERATEVLDRVVGKERLVQESDLSQLNFVKSCMRESFRLHPIAPFNVPHVSTVNATVAGYLIPKGSRVLLSRPGLGRNPRVWDEPRTPVQTRAPQGGRLQCGAHRPYLKMLSFRTGRRGCAGANLGSTMTAMLMARLLQAFSWELPSTVAKIELKESAGDLFLAEPLYVKAQPRLAEALYHQL
ncbi:hypothetical protein Vadar_003554 [Vaccinium darrowii]|uniref:Uncharacterized protein n=1 Tax=Vaccinium darrowii TaxID=229202 RepID=A0ACB7X7R9_9ERIC|nr:hypothetical protein Vadar_003554 [Vaccinium darrowii]